MCWLVAVTASQVHIVLNSDPQFKHGADQQSILRGRCSTKYHNTNLDVRAGEMSHIANDSLTLRPAAASTATATATEIATAAAAMGKTKEGLMRESFNPPHLYWPRAIIRPAFGC